MYVSPIFETLQDVPSLDVGERVGHEGFEGGGVSPWVLGGGDQIPRRLCVKLFATGNLSTPVLHSTTLTLRLSTERRRTSQVGSVLTYQGPPVYTATRRHSPTSVRQVYGPWGPGGKGKRRGQKRRHLPSSSTRTNHPDNPLRSWTASLWELVTVDNPGTSAPESERPDSPDSSRPRNALRPEQRRPHRTGRDPDHSSPGVVRAPDRDNLEARPTHLLGRDSSTKDLNSVSPRPSTPLSKSPPVSSKDSFVAPPAQPQTVPSPLPLPRPFFSVETFPGLRPFSSARGSCRSAPAPGPPPPRVRPRLGPSSFHYPSLRCPGSKEGRDSPPNPSPPVVPPPPGPSGTPTGPPHAPTGRGHPCMREVRGSSGVGRVGRTGPGGPRRQTSHETDPERDPSTGRV